MFNQRTIGGLNPRGNQPQSNLQITTIRSFDGGLNTADTDLNMSPQYARVLDNIERGLDGTLSVRSGTKYFSDVTQAGLSATGEAIINITYFQGYIISVQADGTITKCDGAGTMTMLSVHGTLWTPTITFVSFTIFNGDLIMCNGKDKPIIISGNPTNINYLIPQYLEDLGSGSNINTPIGKYVVAHGQYTVIAGDPNAPSTLHISSKGTSGTYVADPLPNDAIDLDLGPRVSLGDRTITGMVAYRDKLLVTFERGILPINLGVYDTSTPAIHVPTDDGFIEEFGCQAHRTLVSVGDDCFYGDNVGVNSIARISVFNTLRPVRISHLIDNEIYKLMKPLSLAQIEKYVFSVYDLRHFRYIIFLPQLDQFDNYLTTIAYSYTNIPTLKVQAWARITGWQFTCGCRTALENIVFGQGTSLLTYDFDNVDGCADYVVPGATDGSQFGIAISFTWELPWADFKHRMDIKQTRYIGVDTEGKGTFWVQAFVDNISAANTVWSDQNDANALLTMSMVAGDAGGYGASLYGDDPYGGGRRASDERLLAWPAKFKLLKLRFFGDTFRRIKFISISLAYLHGSIRR